VSVYRFITSNILTGQIQADNLPIVGQTATRQVCQVGSFTGFLPLVTASQNTNLVQTWVNALTPWKSLLWVLQDNAPIWGGVITGWPHQSITDGTLPIQAASIENMFKYRQVADTLTYTNLDIFEIFRQEMQYALSKAPNGNISGTGQYANTSGVLGTVANSGVIGSIVENSGFQSIYACFGDLVSSYGIEFTFTPSMTPNGSLYFQTQLGLPQLGRPYSSTGLQFRFPSRGSVDYAWQWIPTTPANLMVVSGTGSTDDTTTYVGIATALSDLDAGYPLLEGNSTFYGTVTSQAQVDQYAYNLLYSSAVNKSLTPLFSAGGDSVPRICDTTLGDEVMLIATSPLHPGQAPGSSNPPGGVEAVSVPNGTGGWMLVYFPSITAINLFYTILGVVGGAYPNGLTFAQITAAMIQAGGSLVVGASPDAKSALEPGLASLFRITGWTLTFPQSQSGEEIEWQLGSTSLGSV
jgi:hypothetical protein